MAAPKLVLHPARETPSTADTVVHCIRTLGLVGSAFDLEGRRHFLTGPAFLDHIAFLGCSPAVALDPPAEAFETAARLGRFCHAQVLSCGVPRLRLKTGQWPRCRHCGASIEAGTLEAGQPVPCPTCSQHVSTDLVNWRQIGGYSRLFIDIWGIHEGEAVPGETLFQALEQRTGVAWRFFYIED